MDLETRVKLAIYHHFAVTTRRPDAADIARAVGISPDEARQAFGRLYQSRVLYLEPDGATIRMAPPFSGVPTQHRVVADGKEYFANCAWDALGIPAALKKPGTAFSRCEQSGAPLELAVRLDEPPASDWLFHCVVPAALWWRDLVLT